MFLSWRDISFEDSKPFFAPGVWITDSAFSEPILIAVLISFVLIIPVTNPEANASPAPVRSATLIFLGNEVRISEPFETLLPFFPKVMQTIFGPSACRP